MDNLNARKRLEAAQKLLVEDSTTRAQFASICTLIEGLNPAIDTSLARIEAHLSTWDKVTDGDVIILSAEHLPENTEEEKKRKKRLLLFINSWRQLKSEVARVEAELQNGNNTQASAENASRWWRILKAAKGPLGLITVLAIGVAVMNQTAVHITIQNKGCPTMYPATSIPISIPGLSLPTQPLPSGSSVEATIPGLTMHIDGTTPGSLALKILTYTLSFQLPGDVSDVRLDNMSLLNKKTDIKLSEQGTHTLLLSCL